MIHVCHMLACVIQGHPFELESRRLSSFRSLGRSNMAKQHGATQVSSAPGIWTRPSIPRLPAPLGAGIRGKRHARETCSHKTRQINVMVKVIHFLYADMKFRVVHVSIACTRCSSTELPKLSTTLRTCQIMPRWKGNQWKS